MEKIENAIMQLEVSQTELDEINGSYKQKMQELQIKEVTRPSGGYDPTRWID